MHGNCPFVYQRELRSLSRNGAAAAVVYTLPRPHTHASATLSISLYLSVGRHHRALLDVNTSEDISLSLALSRPPSQLDPRGGYGRPRSTT